MKFYEVLSACVTTKVREIISFAIEPDSRPSIAFREDRSIPEKIK